MTIIATKETEKKDGKKKVRRPATRIIPTEPQLQHTDNIKTKEGAMLMPKAIYAASFDPFTNGHLDILKTASGMFEEVHVVIAINAKKGQRTYSQIYMKEAIEKVVENNGLTNCKVTIYNGLVAQYCAENNIGYTIRGLRNTTDFEYEQGIMKVNRKIAPYLKTVYLPAEHEEISSSTVKELYSYELDVSDMVPPEVLPVLRTYA